MEGVAPKYKHSTISGFLIKPLVLSNSSRANETTVAERISMDHDYYDPYQAAFDADLEQAAAEVRLGTITLERAAAEIATDYHLSVGAMEIQLSQAIDTPLNLPFCDYWDKASDFSANLQENLNLTLATKLTKLLGEGQQGYAFRDENDDVVKVTRSVQEALFARFLQKQQRANFPQIRSVETCIVDLVPLFLIRRESLIPLELFYEFNPDINHDLIRSTLTDMREGNPNTRAATIVQQRDPLLHSRIAELVNSLSTLHNKTKLVVTDINVTNLALSRDHSRLVIMDFGMNNIESVMGYSLLKEIPTARSSQMTMAP